LCPSSGEKIYIFEAVRRKSVGFRIVVERLDFTRLKQNLKFIHYRSNRDDIRLHGYAGENCPDQKRPVETKSLRE
jgi:hypothetical protein